MELKMIDIDKDPLVERLANLADERAVYARDLIKWPDVLIRNGIDPKKVNGAVAFRADEFNRLALKQLTKKYNEFWRNIHFKELVWWMRFDFWDLEECLITLDFLGIGITEVRRSTIRNLWKSWLNFRNSNACKEADLTRSTVEELYSALSQAKKTSTTVPPTIDAISRGLGRTVREVASAKSDPNPEMRVETIESAVKAIEKDGRASKEAEPLKREKRRLKRVLKSKTKRKTSKPRNR